MLPTESFAEVVGFLRLSDLSALVVTNALCSTLALEVSPGIRWEEFPGLRFYVRKQNIQIFSNFVRDEHGSFHMELVTYFNFPNESATAEFVAAAFRNCVFEHLVIAHFLSKTFLDAIGQIADSIFVSGVLLLSGSVARWSEFNRDVLDLARKFRNAKALELHFYSQISDDELAEIAGFFRGSGIRELWLRFYNNSTLKKVALV